MKRLVLNGVVKKSPVHGWGVFAIKDIRKGGVIEEAPFLIFTGEAVGLQDYVFTWGTDSMCLVLGNGSLYNHSDDNNAEYTYDTEHELITYKALKPIKKGEEIKINYGDEYWATRKIKKS